MKYFINGIDLSILHFFTPSSLFQGGKYSLKMFIIIQPSLDYGEYKCTSTSNIYFLG